MWRLIQRFAEDEVTIDDENNVSPRKIDGLNHLIFKEYQLKYCKCVDLREGEQAYWTGDAYSECRRDLKEIEDERKPESRTFLCEQSRYHITILRNTPSERREHKNEYMGDLDWFKD